MACKLGRLLRETFKRGIPCHTDRVSLCYALRFDGLHLGIERDLTGGSLLLRAERIVDADGFECSLIRVFDLVHYVLIQDGAAC